MGGEELLERGRRAAGTGADELGHARIVPGEKRLRGGGRESLNGELLRQALAAVSRDRVRDL
jgi:hypothetical protein